MAVYRTRVNDADPEAADTTVHLKCSATVRAKLSEFIISSDASPVEQTGEYQIIRTTDTGTTPVAAARVGRNSIGVEIDSSYFGAACRRIEHEAADMFADRRISVHQAFPQTHEEPE